MADHRNASIFADLDALLADLEELYKDIHGHPELSMQEKRTAGIAAERLRAAGYEVTTGVGKTGVVGLLRNGDGPIVMLRADMDALPVTGSRPALCSDVTAPMRGTCRSCTRVATTCTSTWLAGAATFSPQRRETTGRARVMAVFQPGEETAAGAQAMIDDGLFERFPKPDVVLGQHVMLASGRHHRRTHGCRSRRRLTASRSACSGAARTARCRRRASIRS